VVKDVIDLANAKAATDVFFHLAIMTPEQQSEISTYANELGITSFQDVYVRNSRTYTRR
jgi:hypothetical protein